jgi:hypothetical protein
MPLTSDQIQQALAAQRMLADPALEAVLRRIETDETQRAIYISDPATREDARQLVLAVTRLRAELLYDAELPDADRRQQGLSDSLE